MKLILSKNIRGVTKMSKKELVDVIMENIDRFPDVHKLKNTNHNLKWIKIHILIIKWIKMSIKRIKMYIIQSII